MRGYTIPFRITPGSHILTPRSESVFPPSAPVSRALERELRRELQGGLQVWLDKEGRYTRFVERLRESGEPEPVVAYSGSFLRTMMELEGKVTSVTNRGLLLHMPGFNEDDMRGTPLLAYYHAGKRYRRKLETLIENAAAGKVDPDEIHEYVTNQVTTLEAADAWLADKLGAAGNQLSALTVIEIWERLAGDKPRDALGDNPDAVMTHLQVRVAMDKQWLEQTGLHETFVGPKGAPTPTDEKFAILGDILLSWAMAVEYVDDLRREPVGTLLSELARLHKQYVGDCRTLAAFARSSPDFEATYVRVANDFVGKLSAEVEVATAADLGEVDTFLFEDDRIMTEALERLTSGDDATEVAQWAEGRRPERSIWLRRDAGRARIWTLVRAAARLDACLRSHSAPLSGVHTLDAAIVAYRDELWEVDQAHRHLEQKRRRLLPHIKPRFTQTRAMLDALRARYHAWADEMSEAFSKLCAREGFLAVRERQQREIFEQVVRPNVKDSDRLAYVLLDAFRFEMARELIEHLGGPSAGTRLEARLAELPSITAVGMNALAPVSDGGKLTPVMKPNGGGLKYAGFQTGTFQVNNPDTRRRAMWKRVESHDCPLLSLDGVLEADNLKATVRGAGLLVVHALDLDAAGEVGQGTAAFDTILMRVVSAIGQLREAGIKRFVITADHGFLLEPPTETIGANGPVAARYRLDRQAQTGSDVVSVSHVDLRYEGEAVHVVFPRTTRCFAVGGEPPNFVHGGNSMQERVIGVLTLDYKRPSGGSGDLFALQATKVGSDSNVNVVAVELRRQQQALDFASAEKLELTLQPLEPGVELEVVDIRPSGELAGEASVFVEPGGRHEVEFVMRGARDGRTQVRLISIGRSEQIPPVTPDEFFEFIGQKRPPAEPVQPAPTSTSYWASIEDSKARAVLQHLERYGSITEAEATTMLGGARQFRQFSRNVESWQEYLPFNVRVEAGAAGKRYVKE